MNNALLLDTNIWLDLFLPHRKYSKEAQTLVTAAVNQDITLLVTPGSLKDFYYIVERTIKHESATEDTPSEAAREIAWAMLQTLIDMATVVGADYSDVWLAQKHRAIHDDFEDDLLIAAALRAEPRYLITNDAALLKHSPVACLSSSDWCTLNTPD